MADAGRTWTADPGAVERRRRRHPDVGVRHVLFDLRIRRPRGDRRPLVAPRPSRRVRPGARQRRPDPEDAALRAGRHGQHVRGCDALLRETTLPPAVTRRLLEGASPLWVLERAADGSGRRPRALPSAVAQGRGPRRRPLDAGAEHVPADGGRPRSSRAARRHGRHSRRRRSVGRLRVGDDVARRPDRPPRAHRALRCRARPGPVGGDRRATHGRWRRVDRRGPRSCRPAGPT